MVLENLVIGLVVFSVIFGFDVVFLGSVFLSFGIITTVLTLYSYVKIRYGNVQKGTIAFFHPFAECGGGGERVLWAAVQSLQQAFPEFSIAIYCSAESTPEMLSEHAKTRFNLEIKPSFSVVGLKNRELLDPSRYPRLTMVLQAWASVRVACSCLEQLVPEVWIDTTGWAFPYPLVYALGGRIISYVHYPTISTDMLEQVRLRAPAFNNNDDVARSGLKSKLKWIYYKIFALVYGICGGCCSVVMVNSTWTKNHVSKIWWTHHEPKLVYPPCDTNALQTLTLDRPLKKVIVISVAQFRPEKNHELQLEAFALARSKAADIVDERLADSILHMHVLFVGGCRGPKDQARVDMLKAKAKELGLDHVEFRLNVSFSELQSLLGKSIAGIHSMINEHFGISVVEYMAAGAIPIAHNSGGPREDILLPESIHGEMCKTGYLCTSAEEYCDALIDVLKMSHDDRLKMANAARHRSQKFTDEKFMLDFKTSVEPLLESIRIL